MCFTIYDSPVPWRFFVTRQTVRRLSMVTVCFTGLLATPHKLNVRISAGLRHHPSPAPPRPQFTPLHPALPPPAPLHVTTIGYPHPPSVITTKLPPPLPLPPRFHRYHRYHHRHRHRPLTTAAATTAALFPPPVATAFPVPPHRHLSFDRGRR